MLPVHGPGTLYSVFRGIRLLGPVGTHQGTAVQNSQRLLHGALGETGLFGDLAMAQLDRLSSLTDRAPPQEQIDHKGRRAVVMTHQVAQQDVSNVFIEPEVSHGSCSR